MREVIVSPAVAGQLSDIKNYLKNELKLSQDAASAYNDRLWNFIDSLVAEVDYPLCRFKWWRELGYRCAVFEKDWILAYEVVEQGVIVRDMSHAKLLKE